MGRYFASCVTAEHRNQVRSCYVYGRSFLMRQRRLSSSVAQQANRNAKLLPALDLNLCVQPLKTHLYVVHQGRCRLFFVLTTAMSVVHE